jgi:hypothetical protein
LSFDSFLPAVPMGMNGLAEVMAALAESPEISRVSAPAAAGSGAPRDRQDRVDGWRGTRLQR